MTCKKARFEGTFRLSGVRGCHVRTTRSPTEEQHQEVPRGAGLSSRVAATGDGGFGHARLRQHRGLCGSARPTLRWQSRGQTLLLPLGAGVCCKQAGLGLSKDAPCVL